jgi:hypothetical protein
MSSKEKYPQQHNQSDPASTGDDEQTEGAIDPAYQAGVSIKGGRPAYPENENSPPLPRGQPSSIFAAASSFWRHSRWEGKSAVPG